MMPLVLLSFCWPYHAARSLNYPRKPLLYSIPSGCYGRGKQETIPRCLPYGVWPGVVRDAGRGTRAAELRDAGRIPQHWPIRSARCIQVHNYAALSLVAASPHRHTMTDTHGHHDHGTTDVLGRRYCRSLQHVSVATPPGASSGPERDGSQLVHHKINSSTLVLRGTNTHS